MIAAFALMAQGAAPSVAAAEQQARQALASRGVSPAGITTIITIQRRHIAALGPLLQRGRAAEAGVRDALTRRPVDVDGFARSVAARTDAAIALQRDQGQAAIEEMRALSPADRIMLAGVMTTSPRPPAAKSR